jgi:hypothetical protein
MAGPLLNRLPNLPASWWTRNGPVWSACASLGLSLLIAALVWILRAPAFSAAVLLFYVLAGFACILKIRSLRSNTPQPICPDLTD